MPYDANSTANWLLSFGLVSLALFVAFYFTPTIIALWRGHPHALAIFALNLVFGLTLIGWVGALVWALITPGTVSLTIPVRLEDHRREPAFPAFAPPIYGRQEPVLMSAQAEKICPSCAEAIKAAATKCRFCGYQFT